MASKLRNITVENVKIVFRNFSGKEGQYNREGDRNFAMLVDPESAEQMLSDGWNIKFLKPREEGDEPQAYLPIKVKFGTSARPPKVVLITSRGQNQLDESNIDLLDWAEIANVDLIVRPYEWDVQGKQGVSAYLQSIYVTIVEDELEQKYADVPDSAQNVMGRGEEPEDAVF